MSLINPQGRNSKNLLLFSDFAMHRMYSRKPNSEESQDQYGRQLCEPTRTLSDNREVWFGQVIQHDTLKLSFTRAKRMVNAA